MKVRDGNAADFFFCGSDGGKNPRSFAKWALATAVFSGLRKKDFAARARLVDAVELPSGNRDATPAFFTHGDLSRQIPHFFFGAGKFSRSVERRRRSRRGRWRSSPTTSPEKYFCKMVDIGKSRD